MYCYIGQIKKTPACLQQGEIVDFAASPSKIAANYRQKDLGLLLFNLWEWRNYDAPTVDFVYELTGMGHYVDIITNGTLTNKFDKL